MALIGDKIRGALDRTGITTKPLGDRSVDYQAAQEVADIVGTHPISILNRNYQYIFDTLIGNMERQGNGNGITFSETPKEFTYYTGKPGIRLADPDNDPRDFLYVNTEATDHVIYPKNAELTHTSKLMNFAYAEYEGGDHNVPRGEGNADIRGGQFQSYVRGLEVNDIINKTNEGFKKTGLMSVTRNFKTIISRFHTDPVDRDNPTMTAISNYYGMSHGRNLLKLHPDAPNTYDNPYCRVWTYHHQYHRIADLIRPFVEEDQYGNYSIMTQSGLEEENNWNAFRSPGSEEFGFDGGGKRLDDYGVIDKTNGLVNYAPIWTDTGEEIVSVKKCMFSIENLAWKGVGRNGSSADKRLFDIDGLSPEQKGPLGGRIMWFPPYNLKFSENVSPDWAGTQFIGRGEKIWTYANTERSGTLSFTILADHPSIVDYMEKNGDQSTGVDDLLSDENRILRFFAGCEILKPAYQMVDTGATETPDPGPVVEPDIEPVIPDNPPPETDPEPVVEKPQPIEKEFTFFVFYPNNYSGKSDKPKTAPADGGIMTSASANTEGEVVIGSNKRINVGGVSAMDYLANGVGAQMEYNYADPFNPSDIPTSMDSWGKGIGGYEMQSESGISCVSSNPANLGLGVRKRNGDFIYLSKQFGSKTDRRKTVADNTPALNKWWERKWGYRVDKTDDVQNQVLRGGRPNYIDSKSFQLNSTGYEKLLDYFKDVNPGTLYSFADVYRAVNELYGDSRVTDLIGGLSENSDIIKAALKDGHIKKIESVGWASTHGTNPSAKTNAKRNNNLATERARSVVDWLKAMGVQSDEWFVDTFDCEVDENGTSGGSVNDIRPKMYRCAKVTIHYDEPTDETLDEKATEKFNSEGGEDHQKTYVTGDPNLTPADLRLKEMPPFDMHQSADVDVNMTNIDPLTSPELRSLTDNGGPDVPDSFDTPDTVSTRVPNTYRYDNEAYYFQRLSITEPAVYDEITKKIKYFDPAFHSITPEGFNARLTFLHQCTRQGPTVGGADGFNAETANNLSFGRPPVCVLRIGDFYYTKIIIDSLSINYENNKWDLNHEGIGVQPMMAEVSINFKFIGGSDLAGPIARLQNALSFNYYANTGVYDNRAEQVLYGEDGRVQKFRPYLAAGERLKGKTVKKENAAKTRKEEPKVEPKWNPNQDNLETSRKFLMKNTDIINTINNMRSNEVKEEPNDIIEFT